MFKKPLSISAEKRTRDSEDNDIETNDNGVVGSWARESNTQGKHARSSSDLGDQEQPMDNDEDEAQTLDVFQVQKLVLALEKRITKNEEMRIKFANEPVKFMESELALNDDLQRLHIISTVPEFYPELIRLNTPASVIRLLDHENADICVGGIELLNELTDASEMEGGREHFIKFAEALLEADILAALQNSITKMDEKDKDQAEAVHKILGILENMIELKTEVVRLVFTQAPKLVQWIIQRIQYANSPDGVDDNRLYSTEILVILLQNNVENRADFVKSNGVDVLLRTLAPFRTKEPVDAEVIEVMENLFDALCSILIVPEHKSHFFDNEGVELMLLMMQNRKRVGQAALKALNFALSYPSGDRGCEILVEKRGLSVIFPWFLKTPTDSRRSGYSEHELEEHICSIVSSLVRSLAGLSKQRLLNKFVEQQYSKLERVIELHLKYLERANKIDAEIAREKEEYEEMDEALEDEFFLRRLEAGLYTLQHIDAVILQLCACGVEEIKTRIIQLLHQNRQSLEPIKTIVKEYLENVDQAEKDRLASLLSSVSGV